MTGNPGVGDYYREYMSALHSQSQGALPVWCIGHAGHGQLPPHIHTPGTVYYLPSPCLHNYHSLINVIFVKFFFLDLYCAIAIGNLSYDALLRTAT